MAKKVSVLHPNKVQPRLFTKAAKQVVTPKKPSVIVRKANGMGFIKP